MNFKNTIFRRFRESVSGMQEPENFARLAAALWRTLLALAALAAILSIAHGFSLVQDVLALSDTSNAAAQKPVSSDASRKDLDAIVAGFAARKNSSDQLKARPLSAPDPSQ